MPASTAKYGIPYAIGTDALASVDERMQAMAERLDLSLGEIGTAVILPVAANTTVSLRVNYVRNYSTLANVPAVMLSNHAVNNSTSAVHYWVTGEDATGFTLNCRAEALTNKTVRWECRAR